MRVRFTERAMSDYISFPSKLQALVKKQLNLLLNDLQYPSLRAKKYDERRGIWQARVSRDHRFYFRIEEDEYVILSITKHPK